MRLVFSPGAEGAGSSLGANAYGKSYSISVASIRMFGTGEEHRIHSTGSVIKAYQFGGLTGATYINDGRFVNALWLLVEAE